MRFTTRGLRHTVFIWFFIILTDASRADDDLYVGWIESFNGPPQAYALLRGQERLETALFTPLRAADWICILEKLNRIPGDTGNRITLRLNDGQVLSLGHGDTPHLVQRRARPVTLATNLMGWAGGFFRRLHKLSYDTRVISLTTRGQPPAPLSFPLLEAPDLLMSAGPRSLRLAWRGGKKPFRVDVSAETDSTRPLTSASTADSRVTLPSTKFVPGRYRVTIIDAARDTARGWFVVVAADQRPAWPDALARSGLPEDTRTVLAAAWLAEHQKAWRFEAFQYLEDHPETSYGAEILAQWLSGDL